MDGAWRFLNRIWKVFNKVIEKAKENAAGSDSLVKTTHVYLKKITKNYETVSLNKAVALAREFFNEIESKLQTESSQSLTFAFENFIKILSPVTPYICHEMWDILKKATPIRNESWPEIDEKLATIDTVTIAVQVNGKLRGTFDVEKDSEDSVLEKMALDLLGENITHESLKKIIVVKNKIVNVVI